MKSTISKFKTKQRQFLTDLLDDRNSLRLSNNFKKANEKMSLAYKSHKPPEMYKSLFTPNSRPIKVNSFLKTVIDKKQKNPPKAPQSEVVQEAKSQKKDKRKKKKSKKKKIIEDIEENHLKLNLRVKEKKKKKSKKLQEDRHRVQVSDIFGKLFTTTEETGTVSSMTWNSLARSSVGISTIEDEITFI